MNIADSLIVTSGLALVNFTWQGALIGVASAVVLRLLRNARPQLRYVIACGALMFCMMLPVTELINALLSNRTTSLTADSVDVTLAGYVSKAVIPSFLSWAQMHLGGLLLAWSFGVVVLSVRLLAGLIWVNRLTRFASGSGNPYWQAQLDELGRLAGIGKSVRLSVLENLASPAVAGWLQPVVLMPAALITGMPTDLLRALLAHELAHVYRMDYLVNLIQKIIETLLFYHPAVWWISSRIRIERELIADELAANLTGDSHCLARALGELDRVQRLNNELALAANGGKLAARVRQLTAPKGAQQSVRVNVVAPAVSLLLISIALAAGATTLSEPATLPAAAVTKPTFDFKSCKPQYPAQSLANSEEGTVRMIFTISPGGKVVGSIVARSSGHAALDAAAVDAFQKCTMKPGMQAGKPVDSTLTIDYVWKIQ